MKEGDWIDGFEGIGMVVAVYSIVADELHTLYHSEVQIGQHLHDLVQYKMFCDFDGKIRKRRHYLNCNICLCNPICEESKKVLGIAKKEHEKDYEKYQKLEPTKPFGDWANWYLPGGVLSPSQIEKTKGIKEVIAKPFTFRDYKNALLSIDIDIEKLLSVKSFVTPYITISFFNENYEYRKGQRLFTQVNCTVVGENG